MTLLVLNPALAADSRVASLGATRDRATWLDLAALVLFGVVAAVTSGYLRLGLRVPGSSLLLAVLPIALGFAVVPRRQAGTVMGASALVTATLLDWSGAHGYGVGALMSLGAIGPLLDVALVRARAGWRLYAAFVLAGFGANLAAFAVRGGSKLLIVEAPGTRALGEWISQAVVTYALSGALAGLVSAACWFRLSRQRP
jgi:hypothetical protein